MNTIHKQPILTLILGALLALTTQPAVAADQAKKLDLRRAVPADAFQAVYGKHNPERDYQREHFAEVLKTVKETRIVDKITDIAFTLIGEKELEEINPVLEELREATSPINLEALADAKEAVFAQRLQGFTNHQLVALRLGPAAADYEQGILNLMDMAAKYSEGKIPVLVTEQNGVTISTLDLPKEAQQRPAVAQVNGILLVSNSDELLCDSIKLLVTGKGKSKFDDPRLKKALKHLPKPEDSLMFFDGKILITQLNGIGQTIRQLGKEKPQAKQVARIIEQLVDELAISDYEVVVEYTEGNQNRMAAYGKILPDVEKKMLYKALAAGEPFEDWHSWVPAEATSFSLHTGINLQPIYQTLTKLARKEIPEAKAALKQFRKNQKTIDINLDKDIFQAFSGEIVVVTLPADKAAIMGSPSTVVALRCNKPERISELIHRGIDTLKKNPFAASQQLSLVDCENLEGFEQISALMLNGFGIKPVIGFRDGWMMIGSNAAAVKKVLQAKAGEVKTIADTDTFNRFNLEVTGPVNAISYTNLAENTRNTAKVLTQMGPMAQMALGSFAMKSKNKDLKPIQQLLTLLPDVAKIIAKFDFLEERLAVTQAGAEPNTYTRQAVTLIRPKSAD